MNLEIKELWSPDLDPPDTGEPIDRRSFSVFVQVIVGEPAPGGVAFEFMAASVDQLEVASSLPSLSLSEFSWMGIREYVERVLRDHGSQASTWMDLYGRLAPYMKHSDQVEYR